MDVKKLNKFTVQNKVGLLISSGGLIVFVSNFIKYNKSVNGDFIKTISSLSVWLLAILIIPFVFSVFKDNKFLKFLHVIVFVIVSVASSLSYNPETSMPYEIVYAYVFFIISIILAFKYGLLKRGFYIKIALYIIVMVAQIYFSRSVSGSMSTNPFYDTISELMFLGIFVLFLFIIYSDDIKKYVAENKKMKDLIDKNSTYVDFGKNFSTLSHNMRGLISNMSSSVELMSTIMEDLNHKEEHTLDERNIKTLKLIHRIQKKNVDTLISNINTSSALVKMDNVKQEENVKIKLLLNEIVTMHSINPFRKSMLALKYEDNLHEIECKVPSSIVVNVVENLITNAMEAMQQAKVEEPLLLIQSFREDDFVYLSLTDKGPGFKFCEKSCDYDCINCTRYSIGKTTKSTGSGQGIVFVQKAMQRINGTFKIESSKNGSTVIVGFPVL